MTPGLFECGVTALFKALAPVVESPDADVGDRSSSFVRPGVRSAAVRMTFEAEGRIPLSRGGIGVG